MGIRTILDNKATNSHLLYCMWGQSNCSGPGDYAEYSSQFQSAIPNSFIYYNGSMSQLQIGVNNKNNPANNKGGYELTMSYDYQNDTGKNVYIAKRDQGGTQIYHDTGSTSSTSLTIGTGAKTFTIGTGLSYQTGNRIIIYNGSNIMKGVCANYNSGTGSMQVNVDTTSGSGTLASWTVKLMTWNSSVRNEYCDEWLYNYVYPSIDYLFQNNINFKIGTHQIIGEEDGLDTTKANAFETNLKAFYRYIVSAIHNYIQTNYPGKVIPDIKSVISKTKSNSGTGGDTIRAAQLNTANNNPHRIYHDTVNMELGGDNVHHTAAGFEVGGPEVSTLYQSAWS